MQNPIIVALDVPTAEAALKLAEQMAPVSGAFKIGKELFTSAGPDIVRRIRDTGAAVFLDLKFHDIPNTVAKAVASATRLDVQMLTIHTSGGCEMMRAAEQSAQDTAKSLGRHPPLVLGVTVLTSSNDEHTRGNRLRYRTSVHQVERARTSRLEIRPARSGLLATGD